MGTERVRPLSLAIAINLLISTIAALIFKAIFKKRNQKND